MGKIIVTWTEGEGGQCASYCVAYHTGDDTAELSFEIIDDDGRPTAETACRDAIKALQDRYGHDAPVLWDI